MKIRIEIMTNQEWKDIQGYEGIYQVSNDGRVKTLERKVKWKNTLRTIKEKTLEPNLNTSGHYQMHFFDGTRHLLHDLVAQAFIPNPNNYTTVHHKNEDKTDNRVENLMWMDFGEHTAMHHNMRVDQIDCITGEVLHQWESATEAAKQLGFSQAHISQCCNGKRNKHKGYKWSYSNDRC